MEKEDLIKLKEKLSKLSEEEKKERDLYLRDLALGEIQGPPTGYSSIDKPWLKYYTEAEIKKNVSKCSVYEYLYKKNIEHLDDTAFIYLRNKISYRKLFEEIDKTAQSFLELGVEKGDIVSISSITTPEIIYSFYALNKIGAISNMIDPRYNDTLTIENLNEVGSEYLITLDLLYPKIKDAIKSTNIKKSVIISPVNSALKPLKVVNDITSKIKGKKIDFDKDICIDWNNFISNGKNHIIESYQCEEQSPVSIVHTGGTTGVPKGVLLTNENFNNATVQVSDIIDKRGYDFLNIMPPFIAYGIVLGLNAPITLGWKTTIVPQFDASKFDELISKYHPNGIMGIPSYWQVVMNSKKMNNKNMSYLENVLLGGDTIVPEFEKKLSEFLHEHGAGNVVNKGYSMTEASSCATFSSKSANKIGSVGIPLSKTSISAFEPNSTDELETGKIGEICIMSPTIMQEYYNNETATKQTKVKHEDGYWIHSGDLGYVDSDGFVFIKDRLKRMIVRSGYKVFPSELENLFSENEAIEKCVVVGVPDEVDVSAPKAYIVLREKYLGYEDVIEEQLKENFKRSNLPPYFEPVDYEFLDSIPLTEIGKVDYIALQSNPKSKNKSLVKSNLCNS